MTGTRVIKATPGAIRAAAGLLELGELVAFPTETVYGLGADARRADAVAKIYQAKGRPAGNPLIVHVADVEHAKAAVADWTAQAQALTDAFWPGPLTLILRRGESISPLVSAGRDTVAIRCPRHPTALALLREFNGPIAAPSANRSGFTSPTTAKHVLAELAGRIGLILDGGECEIGLESTVLDISEAAATILRPGAVTLEMLREILPEARQASLAVNPETSATSPGQHFRHYAPRTAAYRFAKAEWQRAAEWATHPGPVALLTYDDEISLLAPHETIRMPGDDNAYGRLLFAALREADALNLSAILVLMPETETGMWSAITDRLRRATDLLPGPEKGSI